MTCTVLVLILGVLSTGHDRDPAAVVRDRLRSPRPVAAAAGAVSPTTAREDERGNHALDAVYLRYPGPEPLVSMEARDALWTGYGDDIERAARRKAGRAP